MNLSWLNQVGDWNPQLFREIKGRLKPRNLMIAVTISLAGQLLLLMCFAGQLPVDRETVPVSSRYCTGIRPEYYYSPPCLRDALGGLVINWQLWSLDVFLWMSIIGIFALLVVGTYMLINDLSKEEHRGTLNFIRLSPQSTQNILTGKLFGVPILLYIVAALALPMHLCLGLAAHIPLSLIFGFYSVLVACCFFFYSASLLYGLVSASLGGFQAWLGSGGVLMFLGLMVLLTSERTSVTQHPVDWLNLFSPSLALPYLVAATDLPRESISLFDARNLELLRWFNLPIGASAWSAIGLMLLNYGLWTYWTWQSLQRCFHNPGTTILSKHQSYLLTACFQITILGFSLQSPSWRGAEGPLENFNYILIFNLILCLGLIAALSPHRQALQDWARYRHQKQPARQKSIVKDLVWGEKSPAIVAVAINLAISASILIPWILLWRASRYQISAFSGLLLSLSLILIYAEIAQLMLLMKTPKRAAFASAAVAAVIVLPPIAFGLLALSPQKMAGIWLFSAIPMVAVEHAASITILLSLMGQWLAVTLLGLQLRRQLVHAGESATKALLSGRSSFPIA